LTAVAGTPAAAAQLPANENNTQKRSHANHYTIPKKKSNRAISIFNFSRVLRCRLLSLGLSVFALILIYEHSEQARAPHWAPLGISKGTVSTALSPKSTRLLFGHLYGVEKNLNL
jgi:hypothetical protein